MFDSACELLVQPPLPFGQLPPSERKPIHEMDFHLGSAIFDLFKPHLIRDKFHSPAKLPEKFKTLLEIDSSLQTNKHLENEGNETCSSLVSPSDATVCVCVLRVCCRMRLVGDF